MALRFDELSPREFEELSLALLHAEGYSTRHLGAAGSDGGWDGRATDPDGRLVCVQCKRVANLDAGTAVKELLKVLDTEIISKWIGTTEKNLANEISDLEGPGRPAPRLPDETSRLLIAWLDPLMKQKAMRRLLSNEMGLGLPTALDDFPTPALQASAAVILSRDDDDPIAAALRLIANLQRALDEDESTERLRDLQAIAEELERQRQSQPDASVDRGLLPSWLRKVQRDHERLVDYFQQRHELDLLDRVYVELEMLPHQHRSERDASEKKTEHPSPPSQRACATSSPSTQTITTG